MLVCILYCKIIHTNTKENISFGIIVQSIDQYKPQKYTHLESSTNVYLKHLSADLQNKAECDKRNKLQRDREKKKKKGGTSRFSFKSEAAFLCTICDTRRRIFNSSGGRFEIVMPSSSGHLSPENLRSASCVGY